MPAQNQPLSEIAARRGEHDADENAGDEKDDGVLGEQSEADGGADGQPPAGILRFEQANGEVGDQHPPEEIEGRVLELRALKSGSGESATARAAVTCASRPPPSSRAMSPVTTMAAACARTENRRRPTSERPKRLEADALEKRRQWRIGRRIPSRDGGHR